MPSSWYRVTLLRAITPSGDTSPNASTVTAALPTTARASQRPPATPAAISNTITSPSHSSIVTTDSRSRVSPYASTYRSIRRTAEATTTSVSRHSTPSTTRTKRRSPAVPAAPTAGRAR